MGILRHEHTERPATRHRKCWGEQGQLAQEGVVRGRNDVHQELSSVRTLAKPVLQHNHRPRARSWRGDGPNLRAASGKVPGKLQQSFRKPHARAVKGDLLDGEAERGGGKGAQAGAHWNEDRCALPDD